MSDGLWGSFSITNADVGFYSGNSGTTATGWMAMTQPLRRPAVRIRPQDCRVVRHGKGFSTWIEINGHYYKRVTRRGDRHYYKWVSS